MRQNIPINTCIEHNFVMTNSRTLAQRLLCTAETCGCRPAIWLDGYQISYETLFASAAGVAEHFNDRLPPDASIGILAQRSYSALAGILAAVLSGRPYVPLNPAFPKDRHAMIVGAAMPAAIVYEFDTHGRARELATRLGQPQILIGPDSNDPTVLQDGGRAISPATSVVLPPPPAIQHSI